MSNAVDILIGIEIKDHLIHSIFPMLTAQQNTTHVATCNAGIVNC